MTDKTRIRKVIQPLVGSIAAVLLSGGIANAQAKEIGGATWNTNPVDGNWNNSANWTPTSVPRFGDTATFNNSTITQIGFPSFFSATLDSMVFNEKGGAFSFTLGHFVGLSFEGRGIVNNSGKTQNFFVGAFEGGEGGAAMEFFNTSSAGKNVNITLFGSRDGGEGGRVFFFNNSSAGKATLIALGGATSRSSGPGTLFTPGGGIYLENASQAGEASVILRGNGFLDISLHNPGSVSVGSLSGDGTVFLGSNNLTIGGNGENTTFGGRIVDGGEGGSFGPPRQNPSVRRSLSFGFVSGGSLTKIGPGILNLTGQNGYTGNTYVNGGTLLVNGSIASPFTFVNPGGILGGSGWIGGSVINNGLVSPGNSPGTLWIKNDYQQSQQGGLLIQVASSSVFDRLAIGGRASLGGGTVFVDPLNPQKLKVGQTFDFLNAKGGVYGSFGDVVDLDQDILMRFKVKYGTNDVFLQTFVAPFTGLTGLTPNQQSIATALDSISDNRNARKLINFLATQPINQLPGDFDKLSAEEFTSIFTIGTSFDNVQSQTLQNYLDTLRSGGGGFSAGGLALNGFSVNYAGPIQFRTGAAGPNGGDDGKGSKEIQQVAPTENRWGAFLTGTGEWVGVGDDFNAKGYDIANGGFTLGVDYKINSHLAVGVMAGYVGTGVDLNDGGRVFANGGKLGLYATWFENRQPVAAAPSGMSKDSSKDSSKEAPVMQQVDPGFYADLAVVGGYSSYDVRRSALEGTARGDTDGGDLNVLVGAGYDFKRGNFTFGPTASFNYTYVGVGSFNESGSLAPLRIDSQHQESIRTAFGMKASYDWKVGALLIKPELRAAWQHEYGDATYAIDSSFANGAGGNFTVWGPRIGRDSFLLGAGFAVQINDRLSTYFYYDGELGRTRYDSHAVSGGVRVAF